MAQTHLNDVDWSQLPTPKDDGTADHLTGAQVPKLVLASTDDNIVDLSTLDGLTILFAYPMTGRPDVDLPDGWDMIAGARGCTPQACGFRDLEKELIAAGVQRVFGLSTQSTLYQKEAAARLHLPFPLLSDENLGLQCALNLPTMEVEGMTLLRRLTLAIRDGKIVKTWYPVFPPDRNATDVLEWLNAGTE